MKTADTTALTVSPGHIIKPVFLDRSAGGRPRIHVQVNPGDNSMNDFRIPPHLTKTTLLALKPALVEALAQVKQMLVLRRGSWAPEDGPYFDFTPNFTPDFSARLERLDIPTLRLAGAELEGVYWGSQALGLIRTVFPAEYEALDLDHFDGWWDIFNYFYKLAGGADWFPIHWDLLNHLWDGWTEVDDNPLFLVRFLNDIPIRVFGIGPQEASDFPVLDTLYGLLVDADHFGPHDLRHLGFNIAPEEINPQALASKLVRSDLSHLSPPLNHLAEMALVVIGRTNNPFLDSWFDYDRLEIFPASFCWETDIERLRDAWQSAESIAASRCAFLDWFTSTKYDAFWPTGFTEEDKIRAVVNTIIN